jgi:hypothetical protein
MQPKKRQLMIGAGAAAVSTLLPAVSVGAAETPPKRTLVAAYFGGWCNPIDPAQRFVHGDNPWDVYPKLPLYGNVTHRMGALDANNQPLFKNRFPENAAYPAGRDEAQLAVMEEEIDKASTYGIDVFAMNWYNDAFLNYPVENFKKARNKQAMSWFLQWSNNSNSSTNPPRDSREYFFKAILRAAAHMEDASYWKLASDPQSKALPVFSIYDVTQIDAIIQATLKALGKPPMSTLGDAKGYEERVSMHDAFLQDCHNVVSNYNAGYKETGGITGSGNEAVVADPQKVTQGINLCGIAGKLVRSMHLVAATADVGSWGKCLGLQGMYVYNIRSKWENDQRVLTKDFPEIIDAAKAQNAVYIPAVRYYRNTRQTWWPTFTAGFDNSPWVLDDKNAQHCMPKPEEFIQHCRAVHDAHNGNMDVTGGITFIYAWNEYGEGGWIAPTHDLGSSRLQAVKTYLKGEV